MVKWQDQVDHEIERRQRPQPIFAGSAAALMNQHPPFVEVAVVDGVPDPLRIVKVTCNWMGQCGQEFPDIHTFEEHVAFDHMGLQRGPNYEPPQG